MYTSPSIETLGQNATADMAPGWVVCVAVAVVEAVPPAVAVAVAGAYAWCLSAD